MYSRPAPNAELGPLGPRLNAEVKALGKYFGESPFRKYELEQELIPAFVIAARDAGKRLEEIELPLTDSVVRFFHGYCALGGSMMDLQQLSFDSEVTVTPEKALRVTPKFAEWIRSRIGLGLELNEQLLKPFSDV